MKRAAKFAVCLVRLTSTLDRPDQDAGDGRGISARGVLSFPVARHWPRPIVDGVTIFTDTAGTSSVSFGAPGRKVGHVNSLSPKDIFMTRSEFAAHAERGTQTPRGRATTWIVEDSPLQLHEMQRLLAEAYDVATFATAEEMLELLEEGPSPDVLLLDAQLPGISGLEACRFVRTRFDEVTLPILLVTVVRERQALNDGLEAGANDFLGKPYADAELRARVRTLVRVRELARTAALRARAFEERQRRLLEAAGAGLWDVDLATGALEADPRVIQLVGLPVGSLVTPEVGRAVIHAQDRERVHQVIADALAGANDGRYRVEYRTTGVPGAPERWVESRAQVTFDAGGRSIRIAGAMTDITDRRLAESAAHHQAEFEQQLIGIVSHDLRNPLNVIQMATGLILRRDDLDERVLKAGLRIQNAAQRMFTMIGDLLDFTQARLGGGIPIHPRACDLHAVTQSVAAEVEVTHPDREILLTGTGDGRGAWDPDRLGQVVQNLLTNALKYSPAGTPVAVATSADESHVELSIHNGGPPLPDALRANLFEPFKRGNAVIDAHSRSIGLGLHIVKQVVDAHGGTIDVRSTDEEGTTFRVRLPRSVQRVPPARASAGDAS